MSVNSAPVFGVQPQGNQAIAVGGVVKLLRQADGSYIVVAYQQHLASPGNVVYDGPVLWGADAASSLGTPLRVESTGQPPGTVVDIDAALQYDGKLLIAGAALDTQGIYRLALARYAADGSVDKTFGGAGTVVTSFSGMTDQALCVTAQRDGKIVAAGFTQVSEKDGVSGYWELALARYNNDGTLDTTFNGTGKVVTALGPAADSPVAIQALAGGKLLVLARVISSEPTPLTRGFHLLQYNADGTLDAGFGSQGEIFQATSSQVGTVTRAMAVESDGKIVVFGNEATGGSATPQTTIFVMRFNANGSLDTGFGTQGKVAIPTAKGTILDEKVVQQPDGKFVLAGWWYDGDHGYEQTELIRLNADGSLDTTFGNGGVALVRPGIQLLDFDVQPDGSISATGDFQGTDPFTPYLLHFDSKGTLLDDFVTAARYVRAAGTHDTTIELAPNAAVSDADLHATNNYGGTTVTIARHGGAVASDTFGFDGAVTLSGGVLSVNGFAVGHADVTGGALHISFGYSSPYDSSVPGKTESVVDTVVQHITWQSGGQAAAGSSVIFDWTFDDGSGASNSSVTTTSTVQFSDSVAYAGALANYTIRHQADDTFTVTENATGHTDALTDMARLHFADANVAFDFDGHGGEAYRLYQAAFDRTPDVSGLGYWIDKLDAGATLSQVAGSFIGSVEFNARYGSLDTAHFVIQLYANVLHREPDAGGLFYWENMLDSERITRADALVGFSESIENRANVIGQVENGMVYLG